MSWFGFLKYNKSIWAVCAVVVLSGCDGANNEHQQLHQTLWGSIHDENSTTSPTNPVPIKDTTSPVITLNGGDVILKVGEPYTEQGATAKDTVDGIVTVTTTGSVDTTKAGTYTVIYAAKDSVGNTSTATRSVTVIASANESYKAPFKVLPISGKTYFGALPSFPAEDDIVLGENGKKIIRNFDQKTKHPANWTYFADHWGNNDFKYPKETIGMILSENKIPFVRMIPLRADVVIDPNENATYDPSSVYTLNNIATNSVVIAQIQAWAVAAKEHYNEMKQAEKPFHLMLDFAPEMNGNWFPWGGAHQNPEAYKKAYRKIIDIFREEKVPHVTWVFHPVLTDMEYYADEAKKGRANFKNYKIWAEPSNYYPGDEYIDWVGFSIYGRDEPILSPNDDYYPSFNYKLQKDGNRIFNFAKTKPRMIAEFGVIENPYDTTAKATWYTDAFKSIKNHSEIKAMTYWSESWTDGGHPVNMHIDTSDNSLRAFRNGLNLFNIVKESDIPIAQ